MQVLTINIPGPTSLLLKPDLEYFFDGNGVAQIYSFATFGGFEVAVAWL